jgi:hypothetical protein
MTGETYVRKVNPMLKKVLFWPFLLRNTELLWFLSVKLVPAQAGIRVPRLPREIAKRYLTGVKSVVFCVKIGKISTFFQPKAMIPKSKNQIFQKFFNCFNDIGLRESRISIRGLFSYQTCR